MRSLTAAILALALCACPQSISKLDDRWNQGRDAASGQPGDGGDGAQAGRDRETSVTGDDAGTTAGGDDGGSAATGDDAGRPGTDETVAAPDEEIRPPKVTGCAAENGAAEVMLDEPFMFSCSVDHGGRPVLWSFSASPMNGRFTDLGDGRAAWVLKPADLAGRPDFADTDFTITAEAADAENTAARGSAAVGVRVFGNFWIGDRETHSVMVVGSNGSMIGNVIGPTKIQKPSGLVQLSNGNVLVGEEEDGKPKLQVFDLQGNLVSRLAEQDLAQNDLFGEGIYPLSMIEHGVTGQIWVTVKAQYNEGYIYVYDAEAFDNKIEKPADYGNSFDPAGIIEMSDGNVMVTNDQMRTVFIYSPSGQLVTRTNLGFGQDFRSPSSIQAVVRLSNGEMMMTGKDGSDGIGARFTDNLACTAATAGDDSWWNIYPYYLVEFKGYVLGTTRYSGERVYVFDPETLTMEDPQLWSGSQVRTGYHWLGGIIKLRRIF